MLKKVGGFVDARRREEKRGGWKTKAETRLQNFTFVEGVGRINKVLPNSEPQKKPLPTPLPIHPDACIRRTVNMAGTHHKCLE